MLRIDIPAKGVRSLLKATEPLASGLPPAAAFARGRWFYGAAALASGVLQLVIGDLVRLVPDLPPWVPARSTWAYTVGVVLVATGLAILRRRTAPAAASVVGAMIAVMVLLL